MIRQTFEELKATGNLPSPAGVGMRILKLTQSEDFAAEDLAKTIMSDSALTGRLLRIANSAASGSSQKVTTVAEATMRLGVRAVKNVALGLSVISSNREGKCAGFDYERYWSMSLARAVAAQSISREMRIGIPAECYSLGLLGEIGSLGLASAHPNEYAKVIDTAKGSRGEPLFKFEHETFDIDHAEISAYMLAEWGLPDYFSEAARIFEQSDEVIRGAAADVSGLARVLKHADLMGEYCTQGAESAPNAMTRFHARLESLRLELQKQPAEFAAWIASIAREWTEWGQILEVRTNAVLSLDEIRKRAEESLAASSAEVTTPAVVVAPPRGLLILAVDDDPMSLKLLQRTLSKSGHDVLTASNGNDALQLALEQNPQVVVCDWMMPEMDGLELCKSLRRIEAGRSMYFLLLTGRGEEDRVVEAFDSGVDDYVVKPFNPRVLMARIKGGQRVIELQQRVDADKKTMMKQVAELGLLTRKLRSAAMTDVLTELPNRRYAMKKLEQDWEGCIRSNQPITILMIDIDHFKKVNDTYGHDIGDVVLKETAAVLRTHARKDEEVARLGGEEFLVICNDTTEEQASRVAERLRAAVERNVIKAANYDGHVTISLGIAERTFGMANFEALIKLADEAVYVSKSNGRNQFTLASAMQRRGAKSA